LDLTDQDNEEEIWQTWLHKDANMGYKDFKKKYLKSVRKPKTATISKEEEQKALELAMRFIKPVKEGGEK
jgi:hypothetical protein